MAKISLTIKTNFSNAAKDFKALGDLTDAESKKMKRALERVQGEELAKFERQIRRTAVGIEATKGPTAALAYEQNALARKLNDTISSGIDPQSESLKGLRDQFEKVSSQLEGTTKDFKALGDLTDAESKKMERALGRVEGEELAKFERQTKLTAAAVKETEGPVAALAYEQNALAKQMKKTISSGIDPQSESLKTLKSRYAQVSSQIEATTRAQEINTKATRTAAMAFAALSAATAAGAVKGTRAYADYSESLANLHTLTDISEEKFKAIDAAFTEMSVRYATSKGELAKATYQAVSAGENLDEALKTVDASAKLSRGGLMDVAVATDLLTTATNAYAWANLEAEEAADVYFSIINERKTTGEELAQSIGQSITLFAAAKIPIEELGAGIATLTKVGVPASEATTQLNAVVNAFLKPSKRLSEELQKVGYSSGEALLKAEGLEGALSFLSSASDGAIDSMAELIPNVRGLRGYLAAAAQEGETYSETLANIEESAGASTEAFLRQTEGIASGAFSMEQAKIAVENLWIALGEKLMPAVEKVADRISAILANPDTFERMIDGIVIALGTLGGVFLVLAAKMAIAKIAAFGLGAAMQMIFPTVLITLAVAAIVAGAYLIVKHWEKISAFFKETFAKLGEHFKIIGSAIKKFFIKAFQEIKKFFINIVHREFERLLIPVQKFLSKLSTVSGGEVFGEWAKKIQEVRDQVGDLKDDWIDQSNAAIAQVEEEHALIKQRSKERIAEIKAETAARLEQIAADEAAAQAEIAGFAEVDSGGSGSSGGGGGGGGSDGGGDKFEEPVSLTKKLAVLQNVEAVAHNERLAAFGEFLSARMDQEKVAADERIAFLGDELGRINALETLTGDERISATQSVIDSIAGLEGVAAKDKIAALEELGNARIVNEQIVQDAIIQIQKEAAEEEKLLREQKWEAVNDLLEDMSGIFGNIQIVMDNAAQQEIATEKAKTTQLLANAALTEEQRSKIKTASEKRILDIEKKAARDKAKMAVAQKAVDIASTIITTAKAAMAAFSSLAGINVVLAAAAAAATIALGATQVAVIASTPIPAPPAETGGRFVVPEARGVDNVGLRVNPGERVDVTPRGDDEERSTTINVHIDREVIWSITQQGIDEGIIDVTPDNLRAS